MVHKITKSALYPPGRVFPRNVNDKEYIVLVRRLYYSVVIPVLVLSNVMNFLKMKIQIILTETFLFH